MNLLLAVLAFLVVSLTIWWFRGRLTAPYLFWRLVADHPDDAYDWFASQPDWILAKGREDASARAELNRYAGPFQLVVPKFDQALVLLYARRDSIASSQVSFLGEHARDWPRPRPRMALLAFLYPVAAMYRLATGPAEPAGVLAILGYGVTQLAYLLVVATVFPGRFTPFGLTSRPATLAGAVAAFVLGVVLVNL